jgi:hypothetical protein
MNATRRRAAELVYAGKRGRFIQMPRRLALLVVLGCLSLAAAAPLASSGSVPHMPKAQIHALISPYDFYPARISGGLIYIKWQDHGLSPSVCGELADITFAAAGGKQLIWSSSRACDGQGRVGCSARGYPGYADDIGVSQKATINHRRIYFSQGNHGSNAWTCIPLGKVGGFTDFAAVGIWENYLTPLQAMQLVASAVR